ncbi:MAG: class B sortase, partial [Ruminococcus sp.]|nr:class B sortase [Ruminococcus sp.]
LWRSKRLNDKLMNMYWTYQDEEPEKPSEVKVVNENGEEEIRKKYSILPGARKLLDINSDVVGVISIPDTKVNNPLMQADDNSKYLNMKIDGSESRAGEIFLDFRNHFDEIDDEGYLKYPNSDNLVIYGHNMGDETMFGTLKYYHRNGDYYGEHPIIELNSNCMTYKYKIFAFFILDADDDTSTKFDCWNKLNFSDEKEFYNFVNEAKRRTLRLNDVDVKYGDKLVTLSTCNTYLGDRGRLIIMGRLVREGEDPMKGTQNSVANPNIKWPTMYYNTKTNEHYDPDADFEPYGP